MVEDDAAAPPRGLTQIEDAAAAALEGYSGKTQQQQQQPLMSSEGSRDEGLVEPS